MRSERSYAGLLAIAVMLMMVTTVLVVPRSSSQTVQTGEPLHVYLRRDPVQNVEYLDFHPSRDDIVGDNKTYRTTLQQKDNKGDHLLELFPRHSESNFLQFEPNITLRFRYHFVILAQTPTAPIPGESRFKVNVKIEIDYDKDRNYDRELTFDLSGDTSPEPQVLEGTISLDTGSMEKFSGISGGRLRVNISRQDGLPSTVIIYCGTDGQHSWFQLPYSKFKYESEPEDDNDVPLYMIFIVTLIVLGVTIALLVYWDTKQKRRKELVEKEPKGRRGRKR